MKRIAIIALIACTFTISCDEYLAEVPDRSLAILTKVDEFQQLMDEETMLTNAPGILDLGTDDLFIPPDQWASLFYVIRNAYVWNRDIYEGNTTAIAIMDWSAPYEAIYYANVALDGLQSLDVSESELVKYNDVKGQALFVRAFHHYLLQETFGQPFRPGSVRTDLGIPLKLSPVLTAKVERATVSDTFDQIINDLRHAAQLLTSDYEVAFKNRASKATAYAMLSRVFLTMQDYEASRAHADTCLSLYSNLIDFNDLSPAFRLPFPDNAEVLLAKRQNSRISGINPVIDAELFDSYDASDLRKSVFFQLHAATNTQRLKTLYSGNRLPFAGLALDEVYLNRAECRARLGDIAGAMDDLNNLLENRYDAASFTPRNTVSAENALDMILSERRKELIFRGTRWTDLRRLNQDPQTAKRLTRSIDGVVYVLPPNALNFTYPIPLNEVIMNGLIQNERHETTNP